MQTGTKVLACVVGLGAMFVTTSAMGQYASDFEGLDASADGVLLTGQDGYYIPSGTDSVDAYAYTYAGNVLGVPANPDGIEQFIAGVGPGSPTFSRAQRDIPWGTGVWKATYDTCAFYQGEPPSQNNLGSFSVQPYPGSASYIHLFSWVDANDPVAWQGFYLAYDESGRAHSAPGMSPGDSWTNLSLMNWYRFETWIDFSSNRIVQVAITDLSTGASDSFNPTDWYCEGGAAGGSGTPTGFRFFAGGGVPGNGVAWDNIDIHQDSAPFSFAISGECPGALTLSTSGGTPGGRVAFAYSLREGSWTIPGGPCAGLELGIIQPTVAGYAIADGSGNASMNANAPAAACGRVFLQAVDVDPCTASNVIAL